MTNRFHAALSSIADISPDLMTLSSNFHAAVFEACAYDKNPRTDPAVLLLSMQIGFATNADFATALTFDQLIESCKVNAARPVINPLEVH